MSSLKNDMPAKPSRRAVLDALCQRRFQALVYCLANARRDQGERLAATRKLFGGPVVVVDLHSHSTFSDGRATIAMNRDAALEAGIDILFATDHHSRKQKSAVRGQPSMSWGQEPGALHHHIGLLCNTRLFKPRGENLRDDFEHARRLAPFVWIPHPAGWYPQMTYSEAQKAALWTLGSTFAMEVINGAHKIGAAFDRFDVAAVALWDRLLCDGMRVTPLGASDAHVPESIGSCWTALPGIKPSADAVIKGLKTGHCLASESTLLGVWVNDSPMGSSVQIARGRRLVLRFRAADAAGLQAIRIMINGRVRKTIYNRDATCVDGEWCFTPPARGGYVRLESRATDNRRAFSAPVYLQRHP